MQVVIATSTAPKDVDAFFQKLHEIASDPCFGCVLLAGVYCTGSGCYNLGLDVTGEDEQKVEKYVNCLTMALMPARWSSVENDRMLIPGKFYSTFAPKVD